MADSRDVGTPELLLTAEGRLYLDQRRRQLLEDLASERILMIKELADQSAYVAYRRKLDEFVQLSHAFHSAGAVEDIPDDPEVVKLGDRVVLRLANGTIERYLLVHALEASANRRRISSESPLGVALLGRRVGEEVEVRIRSTPHRVVILSASREGYAGNIGRSVDS